MKTSVHVTALNCQELLLIERVADSVLANFFEHARRQNIKLPDFSGGIDLYAVTLPSEKGCGSFRLSVGDNTCYDTDLPFIDGVGAKVLVETITTKVLSYLRVIFAGRIRVSTRTDLVQTLYLGDSSEV